MPISMTPLTVVHFGGSRASGPSARACGRRVDRLAPATSCRRRIRRPFLARRVRPQLAAVVALAAGLAVLPAFSPHWAAVWRAQGVATATGIEDTVIIFTGFESVTGFGIGAIIAFPLLRRMGFVQTRAAALALLGFVTVPWGRACARHAHCGETDREFLPWCSHHLGRHADALADAAAGDCARFSTFPLVLLRVAVSREQEGLSG